MHVADIMPTLLDIANAQYPKTLEDGRDLPPLVGKSWLPMLSGQAETPRTAQDYLAWEIFGNRALIQGEWKIRWQYKSLGTEDWELFNIATDPGERKDLADEQPEKLNALLKLWDSYVKENNVILPSRSPFETMEDALPPRVPVEAGYPPANYQQQFIPPQDMMAEPKK
jgi:arylsulfatase